MKRILDLVSKPLIRMVQMINRCKATENAQLLYLCKFFQILHSFRVILKIQYFGSTKKRRTVIWAVFSNRLSE
jgi:hypothetical protein